MAAGLRPAPGVGEDSLLAPGTLARTLRAVAAELERDPALARRVAAAVAAESAPDPASAEPVGASSQYPQAADAHPSAANAPSLPDDTGAPPGAARLNRSFRPRLVPGASPNLGAGIPDPFALYHTLGADGLRAALDELRLGSLRAIVREHGLDPKGSLSRQNDAAKLRAAILKAVARAGTRR